MIDEINAYVQALAERVPTFAKDFNFAVSKVGRGESPLEYLFLALWVGRHSKAGGHGSISYAGHLLPEAPERGEKHALADLQSQVKFGRHRVDYLVVVTHPKGKTVRFAVELDGHTYHDRTPKQASADRARDRKLLREGVVTVRYTTDDLMSRTSASIDDFWDTLVAFTRWCQP